jgi:integrase
MSLVEHTERYIMSRDLCGLYAQQLRSRVGSLERWANRPLRLSDLTPDLVSEWLYHLQKTDKAPETVNGYRRAVLTIWRWATPSDQPLPRLDRVRTCKTPDKPRPAFTLEELQALLHAATLSLGSRPDGLPWCVWWPAYIHSAYSTGQYLSDLARIGWVDVRPDRRCTFVRRKTGRAITVEFSSQAIEWCERIKSMLASSHVLPWTYSPAAFSGQFRRLTRKAGVREGTPKWIRRSAVSYAEAEHPGNGRVIAGHSSQAITDRHYRDWTIAPAPVVRPPSLES